jgi:hypothetical protein
MPTGIESFWSWWPQASARLRGAIEGGGWPDPLIEEVDARVKAIDEGLAWGLCPGHSARHAFCLSSAGDPERRATAERWRLAAPTADGTWEFHAARQPQSGLALRLDDHVVDPADLSASFRVDVSRERIDVALHHPDFAVMPENARAAIALLALSGALGEDGVERWIGEIDLPTERPAGALALSALEEAVAALAKSATGERFEVLRGEDDAGRPIFVSINRALKRIDHVLKDRHVEIMLPLLNPTETGLTTNAEADQLNRLEDELCAAAGPGAVFAARETGNGVRIVHLFAEDSQAVRAGLAVVAGHHPERRMEALWEADPRWGTLGRWEVEPADRA